MKSEHGMLLIFALGLGFLGVSLASGQTRGNIGNTRGGGTSGPSSSPSTARDDGRSQTPVQYVPPPPAAPVHEPSQTVVVPTGDIFFDAGPPPPPPGGVSMPILTGAMATSPRMVREVLLANCQMQPSLAGYDFSDELVIPCDDSDMDVFYEWRRGEGMLHLPMDTEIRDLGPAEFGRIGTGEGHWSLAREIAVQPGYAYLVREWDESCNRILVSEVTANRLLFEWSAVGRIARGDGPGGKFGR